MIQGTSSNAGKSILTAALCRIFLQDGLRVAPFKAQNMALNSFVTRAGCEMGRAQVVQAQACRLDPDVRMNPVLLKPNSDTGSQVIVMGKPVGNLTVESYIDFKAGLFERVAEAYDSLASEFDILVLEGAGSPAEVNLKAHDIVNMRMARYAGAPVLLVGDIDRGGVFASFLGTYEILDPEEREILGGYIINKFRGRKELLAPALDFMRRRTGKDVLGVIPMLERLGLPEEDSVSFKETLVGRAAREDAEVSVAILDLPHISNFTDFDPLFLEPCVSVRVVGPGQEIGDADCVIIPGSKNVGTDLAYLREKGYGEEVRRLALEGRIVAGICGGYQMLGASIDDPKGLEFHEGRAAGLGLLNITTVMDVEKTLCQVEGRHVSSGLAVKGYEIHNGRSIVLEERRPFAYGSGEPEGAQSSGGNVWGTYIHGVFDADGFRHWFLNDLRARRGLPARPGGAQYEAEPAFERLASVVRESLDMERIYRLAGL
jgi:cobyric acid synthase CobQ